MAKEDDALFEQMAKRWFETAGEWMQISIAQHLVLEKCMNNCGGCRNEEALDPTGTMHVSVADVTYPCLAPGAKFAIQRFEEFKNKVMHGT